MSSIVEHIPVEHLPFANELVTRLPYAESALRERITGAVGAASTCWGNLDGAGVFDSERAAEIARELIDDVLKTTHMGEPNLGCATTKEIAEELLTRVSLGHADPDYRTVD